MAQGIFPDQRVFDQSVSGSAVYLTKVYLAGQCILTKVEQTQG